jgi:multidrug resistance efflux pump
MKPIVRIITTGMIVLAAIGMIAYKYHDYMKYPWTRDGLVRAQVVQITPRVSGPLVRVPVQNNQLIKKGDLLFEIDPSIFRRACIWHVLSSITCATSSSPFSNRLKG